MGPLQWNTNRQCGTFVQARIFQYYMLRVKAKMMHLKLDSPIRYIFLSSLQTSSLQLYNYQWLVLFSEGIFWLIFSLFEQKMNVADLFFVSVWTSLHLEIFSGLLLESWRSIFYVVFWVAIWNVKTDFLLGLFFAERQCVQSQDLSSSYFSFKVGISKSKPFWEVNAEWFYLLQY